MLARLLRAIYLFQLICGGLLGSFLAVRLSAAGAGSAALLLVPLCALALPVLLQFLTISVLVLRAHSGGAWGLWWRALWGEFKAAVLIFMLRQPWPQKHRGVELPLGDAPTPSANSALPVLLVHGYICNHRVWDDVALALRHAGHPVLRVDLEPLFTSIDDYASILERAVTTLLAQTQARQVVLVGHSMGGLAIRAWLRAYGTERVARIVTLGTPHQGTRVAQASMTPNGAQMVWHSPWLQALAESEDPGKRALMRIALTTEDNVVYPQAEQVLPGAQVTRFEGIGHLQMCLDADVIRWVCQQAKAVERP